MVRLEVDAEAADTFKMLIGGDWITAERKYGQPFEFKSYATLVFSANEWPVSHDQTDAYFTRIAIPFTNRYVEGEPGPGERRADPKLIERLTTRGELEGLLVRAVRGALRLQERGGFVIPDSVRDAVSDYRQWVDTVLAWASERVRPMPGHRIERSTVYLSYQAWATENGRKAVSAKRFWPRLREILDQRGIPFQEVEADARELRDVMI